MDKYVLRKIVCKWKKNEIVIFENQGVKLEVNMKEDIVWLTQNQMVELFDRNQAVIKTYKKIF